MFAWSHNFYATYTKGKVTTYYCFEQKKDRDEALKYHFHKCSAQEAYKNYHRMKRIEWREFDRFIKPYRTKIMPCACLRCKKSIPITYGTMAEVSYTHYSYCEDCLRKGLKALKAFDEVYQRIYDHHYEILKSENGERRDAKLSLSNWVLDLMTGYDIEEGAEE